MTLNKNFNFNLRTIHLGITEIFENVSNQRAIQKKIRKDDPKANFLYSHIFHVHFPQTEPKQEQNKSLNFNRKL